MKILFDHNMPKRFRRYLAGHIVQTTREMRWENLSNGRLLKAAANAGFESFVSVDKKMEHEQNLRTLPLPVILLDSISNALPALVPFAPFLLQLLNQPLDNMLYIIQPDGTVLRLTAPRV